MCNARETVIAEGIDFESWNAALRKLISLYFQWELNMSMWAIYALDDIAWNHNSFESKFQINTQSNNIAT